MIRASLWLSCALVGCVGADPPALDTGDGDGVFADLGGTEDTAGDTGALDATLCANTGEADGAGFALPVRLDEGWWRRTTVAESDCGGLVAAFLRTDVWLSWTQKRRFAMQDGGPPLSCSVGAGSAIYCAPHVDAVQLGATATLTVNFEATGTVLNPMLFRTERLGWVDCAGAGCGAALAGHPVTLPCAFATETTSQYMGEGGG